MFSFWSETWLYNSSLLDKVNEQSLKDSEVPKKNQRIYGGMGFGNYLNLWILLGDYLFSSWIFPSF